MIKNIYTYLLLNEMNTILIKTNNTSVVNVLISHKDEIYDFI